MLISLAASFLVVTLLATILVPQRGTPTWRTHALSCNFLEIILSITLFWTVLSTQKLLSLFVFTHHLLLRFSMLLCKQTHFIITMKTKNRRPSHLLATLQTYLLLKNQTTLIIIIIIIIITTLFHEGKTHYG